MANLEDFDTELDDTMPWIFKGWCLDAASRADSKWNTRETFNAGLDFPILSSSRPIKIEQFIDNIQVKQGKNHCGRIAGIYFDSPPFGAAFILGAVNLVVAMAQTRQVDCAWFQSQGIGFAFNKNWTQPGRFLLV